MLSAGGTRRSLLHDVLSQSEVVELGLDGTIDDLPPLATRLLPSCARAFISFCWVYFFCFWIPVAVVLHHVAVTHPETLLPGHLDLIFISVCTTLLVCAELAMYYYVKAENPLPESRGLSNGHFTPSASCVAAHFALSATSRMCTFLEILFLLHTLVLPTPMLVCAMLTISLTSGAVPFLFQLRSLLGYQCDDLFDPLHLSTFIPLASIASLISRVGTQGFEAVVKGLRFATDLARVARCRVVHLAGLCAVRVVRRTASVPPGRRVDPSCRAPGSSRATCQALADCESGLVAGLEGAGETPSTVSVVEATSTTRKGRQVCPAFLDRSRGGSDSVGNGEPALSAFRHCRASPSDALATQSWTDHLPEESTEASLDAHIPPRNYEGTRIGMAISSSLTSESQAAPADADASYRGTRVFIAPRKARELTDCLLFLDLQILALHVKAVRIQQAQLENLTGFTEHRLRAFVSLASCGPLRATVNSCYVNCSLRGVAFASKRTVKHINLPSALCSCLRRTSFLWSNWRRMNS